jgi:hypothetical protein
MQMGAVIVADDASSLPWPILGLLTYAFASAIAI